MDNFLTSILKATDDVKREFRNRVAAYLTAAFGLVVGLAWNDAIKSLIKLWFPNEQETVLLKFVYAIVATIVFIIISLYIIHFIKNEEKNADKKST